MDKDFVTHTKHVYKHEDEKKNQKKTLVCSFAPLHIHMRERYVSCEMRTPYGDCRIQVHIKVILKSTIRVIGNGIQKSVILYSHPFVSALNVITKLWKRLTSQLTSPELK